MSVLVTHELTLSLPSAAAVAFLAVVMLLPRQGRGAREILTRVAVLAGCVALPAAAIWAQIAALDRKMPKLRPGNPGEFVVDGNILPGTLVVDLALDALPRGQDPPTSIRLSDGTTKQWSPEEPAVFEGLQSGRGGSFFVLGPYRARSSGVVEMPADKGVRVRVPALRVAPTFDCEEEYTPERVLHVDVTDPLRYRLSWASGQVVHTMLDVPRDER